MDFLTLRDQTARDITGDFSLTREEFAGLGANDKIKIANSMNAYIKEHPEEFGASTVNAANKFDGNVAPTESYDVLDKASDFLGEVGDQAVSLNESLNPFSESNRNKVLVIAALAAIVYYVGPVIIKALAESKTASAK